MIVNELFEIVFVDRIDCEHLLAQVRFKNIGLCEISKEKGNDGMDLEVLCNDVLYNGIDIKFPFDDFLEALSIAKAELMDL